MDRLMKTTYAHQAKTEEEQEEMDLQNLIKHKMHMTKHISSYQQDTSALNLGDQGEKASKLEGLLPKFVSDNAGWRRLMVYYKPLWT